MNSADQTTTRTARTPSGSPQAANMRARRDEEAVSGSEDVVAVSPAATSSTGRLSRVRVARVRPSGLLHLQLDVDARRKIEALESLDGLAGRLDDVDEALVNAHLEMLAAVLVEDRKSTRLN